jgi:hypothetical protein
MLQRPLVRVVRSDGAEIDVPKHVAVTRERHEHAALASTQGVLVTLPQQLLLKFAAYRPRRAGAWAGWDLAGTVVPGAAGASRPLPARPPTIASRATNR